MGYDLLLTTAAPMPSEAIQALIVGFGAALAGCELVPHPGAKELVLSIKLPDDEDQVAALWPVLVRTAVAEGFGIFDPQRGQAADLSEAGKFPPGWIPRRGVKGRSLQRRTGDLFQAFLAPRGFHPRGLWIATRDRPGLRQGVYVLKGTGRRSGSFTLQLFWSFTVEDPEPEGLHGSARIGELLGSGELWYPEDDFERAREDLFGHGLPYLDRFGSVAAIVEAFETGVLTAQRCFGVDPGWQRFHIAECYEQVGRTAAAAAAWREVIDEHSGNHLELQIERLRASEVHDKEQAIRRAEEALAAFKGSAQDWVFRREQAARRRLAAWDPCR